MTLHRVASSLLMLATAALFAAGAWWLISDRRTSAAASKPTPAATVVKVVKEESLATVTLTEDAENRLGIKTSPVERKTIRRVRFYGGEAMVPAGRATLVSAPLSGVIQAPKEGMKQVGRPVKKGEPLLLLSPLLTPEARATLSASMVDAEGQENNAKAQLEAATIALERARRLLREEAGSKRNVDETQATYDVAVKTLEAATARRTVLSKVAGELNGGTAAPLRIDSPDDGILRNLNAMPGQFVPNGGALFEVVNLHSLWIRVPTPVGDLADLVRDQPAEVGLLSMNTKGATRTAKSVSAPPSANALSGTVDLYFEIENSDGSLIPGQRLGVNVSLKHNKEALAVPLGAVVYDIHGGSWVYERNAPRTYLRRRVVVDYVADGFAALQTGPAIGVPVVVEGALELFAAETGYVK